MSPNATIVPPPIMWAQRTDIIYLTVTVECKDIEYKFTESSMYFKGVSTSDATKTYEVTLNFLNKINPDKVINKNTARCIEFTITKAESGPYWNSLTTDKKKPHFLKVDFNKWVDEDNADDEEGGLPGGDNLKFMEDFGNLNKFSDKKHSFDDFNPEEEEDDSDDENLPNLE
ncbi:hypothetical protein HA402_012943 [Bradysia odoriphaga]|nr:hypothetical protein HA402_012943 [Bradysia odoriphaga]